MPRASLAKQPEDVARMFDAVARRYDVTNGLLSLGQDRRWRRATTQAVAPLPGERILDLAAGTGASSLPFARAGANVVACDLSQGMIDQGRRRHPELTFVRGDATALPFDDDEFDVVTISFGLRNVVDVPAALAEMLRVTRPGGRLVVAEFSTPTWPPFARVYDGYLMRALPGAAAVVTRQGDAYRYLAESIRAWPDQEALASSIRQAGWRSFGYRNLTGGVVALHRARKP
jgi:demethylmenaquinone methyltransferase/2-methoxy-6-polyprenyl-1,4-benzoquinol methylase